MPDVIPVPARTKGLPWWKATWNWLTVPTFWMLAEDYLYRLKDGTWVLFKKGFMFDGASIPRIFWRLIHPTGIMFLQGLLHDWGYRFNNFIRLVAPREILYRLNHAENMAILSGCTELKDIEEICADKEYVDLLVFSTGPYISNEATQEFWDNVFREEGDEINGMRPLNYAAWLTLLAFGHIAWNKLRAKNEKM